MSLLKVFPLYFKMAESSENLDNILRGQAKDKVQRSLAQALNRYEKQAEQIKPFLLEKESEKNTRAVSGWQSSETIKPSTKLVSREPLLYLGLNKPNKQNVSVINYLKNSTFLSLKITVDTMINVRNET